MALESAQYVGQLVSTNPLSTDTVSQSGDHLRLIKQALVNTFPNLTAPVSLTAAQLSYPVPQGAILLWSGAVNAIPTGYALCDGTQGTPNLTDVFVVGAGHTYAVGATGGSATTGFAGGHTHTGNNASAALTSTTVSANPGAGNTVVTGTTDTGHSHTINSTGDHQHTSLPPYYGLAYIMKL
jgi:hypothetical protein